MGLSYLLRWWNSQEHHFVHLKGMQHANILKMEKKKRSQEKRMLTRLPFPTAPGGVEPSLRPSRAGHHFQRRRRSQRPGLGVSRAGASSGTSPRTAANAPRRRDFPSRVHVPVFLSRARLRTRKLRMPVVLRLDCCYWCQAFKRPIDGLLSRSTEDIIRPYCRCFPQMLCVGSIPKGPQERQIRSLSPFLADTDSGGPPLNPAREPQASGCPGGGGASLCSGIAPGGPGTSRRADDALVVLGTSGLERKVRAVCAIQRRRRSRLKRERRGVRSDDEVHPAGSMQRNDFQGNF